jgi:hypothetical protein
MFLFNKENFVKKQADFIMFSHIHNESDTAIEIWLLNVHLNLTIPSLAILAKIIFVYDIIIIRQ